MKKSLILISLVLINTFSFGQERTFLDQMNESTPVFLGCENAENKSECYRLKISNIVLDEMNKKENLVNFDDFNGTKEIRITLRNEINGEITLLENKADDTKIEDVVKRALKNLPLIRPIVSFRDKEPKTATESFIIVIEKKSNNQKFELVYKKTKQDFLYKPSKNTNNTKNVVIEGCERESMNYDCFYIKLNNFISKNIDYKIVNNQRIILQIKFDKNGKIDEKSFNCSVKKYRKYFLKMFESLVVIEPAEFNGEKIDMTYSIPVQINVLSE